MFGAKKRKEETESARARIRDLTAAIAERRKPGDSQPPATGATRAREQRGENFTPNGTRRIGFVPRG